MTQGAPDDAAGWVDAIFAPLGIEAFLSQSFGHSLLRLPGTAGRFAPLLDWQGLSRLLEWTPLLPPRIELARGGRTIGPERFITAEEAPQIDAGRLSLELDQGATLIVNYIDHSVPRLADLTDQLARTLCVRVGLNLYVSWKADHGLALHWDTHGVIVLQLAGRKQWTVHAPTRPDPVSGDGFEPHPPPMRSPCGAACSRMATCYTSPAVTPMSQAPSTGRRCT